MTQVQYCSQESFSRRHVTQARTRKRAHLYVSKLASLLMEDMLRMLMEAHGVAHGPEGGMADLGRALGMLGTDEDCRDLDDNPERLQPDLIPGVVVLTHL